MTLMASSEKRSRLDGNIKLVAPTSDLNQQMNPSASFLTGENDPRSGFGDVTLVQHNPKDNTGRRQRLRRRLRPDVVPEMNFAPISPTQM